MIDNIKWHFPKHRPGDDLQGIRDGDIELFDRYRYASVVRESIQNSMDARFDDSKPVIVEYEFFKLNKNEFPDLFNIELHLKACSSYETINEDDKEYFKLMLDEAYKNHRKVEVLRISDYNTIGMDAKGSYEIFAKARNISSKQSNSAAGSKGMGKAAYFSLSYLRSILVSSRTPKNEFLFQGISRLSMHKLNGELLKYKGFYGYEDLEPATEPNNVAPVFQRPGIGTSIFILGLWDDQDRITEMKRAILNSFWLAILEKQLIVSINGETFDHENVYDFIKIFWTESREQKQYNVQGNPRPYFETWKETGISRVYSKTLPHLGLVKCVFAKHADYPGIVAYFRKSKMLIQKQSGIIYKGYCGVFLCDDEKGNEYLKKLENARHDKWESGNWKNPLARVILKELNDFIANSFVDFAGDRESIEISIPKLAELIGIRGKKEAEANNNPAEGKTKGLSRPRSKTIKPKTDKEPAGHKINSIFSYATSANGEIIYNINIESNEYIQDGRFDIFVSGDNERLTTDNIIPIKSITNGKYEGNSFIIDLNPGQNTFLLTLESGRRHSLKINARGL